MKRHGPVEDATPAQKVEASALGGAISQCAIMALTRMSINLVIVRSQIANGII